MNGRDVRGGLLLFLVVVALYHVTFSSVPTSDGYAWIASIDRGDPEGIFRLHACPMYLLFKLKQLLTRHGMEVPTLVLM